MAARWPGCRAADMPACSSKSRPAAERPWARFRMTSDARFVMRVRCQPPKKNVLFFLIGPPPNPPYWLRLRKSFSAAKKPFELNVRSRRYSNAPPWNAVRSRARDDVHDGARVVAMRRAVVRRLNREFLECVGEREALVFLEVRVGVVRAIQPVRVLALAGAVGRNADRARDRLAGFLADRRQHGARDERLQPRHFAAGDRQLDDARVVDDLADGRRRDVDRAPPGPRP